MRLASSASSLDVKSGHKLQLDRSSSGDKQIIAFLRAGRYCKLVKDNNDNLREFLDGFKSEHELRVFLSYAQEKDLLTRSALYGSGTMFHWLLANGADPNAYNRHHRSYAYKKAPVHVAAQEGDASMIAALNNRGANLAALSKSRGRDALFYAVRGAAMHGRIDALRYLLKVPGYNIARAPSPLNFKANPVVFYTYLCSLPHHRPKVYYAHSYIPASKHNANMSQEALAQHKKQKRKEASKSHIGMLARSWMSDNEDVVKAVYASPAMQDDAVVVDAYKMVHDAAPSNSKQRAAYKDSILYRRLKEDYRTIMREFAHYSTIGH